MLGICEKSMMQNLKKYLNDSLGLNLDAKKYTEASSWPIFLARAAHYYLCRVESVPFIIASVPEAATLPELKRIFAQISKRVDIPVVLASNNIDARQRKALVQQGIPFTVPDKQAYLPFLGLVAATKAEKRALGDRLSPSSQASLVAIIANPMIRTAADLIQVTNLTKSSISRALDELSARKLIDKSKDGRSVVFSYDKGENALLRAAMPYLATPVLRTVFAKKTHELNALPDAGESALAARSMLTYPKVAQKAVARNAFKKHSYKEVLEGELSNDEVLEIQIWSYDPLGAGLDTIDNVSLALSLVDEQDERIDGELNALFHEENLWQ